jgi:hypothetical protein
VSKPHPAMRLLRAGIPLSLLLDLADPDGPDTRGIMAYEAHCAQAETAPLSRELAGAAASRSELIRGLLGDSS